MNGINIKTILCKIKACIPTDGYIQINKTLVSEENFPYQFPLYVNTNSTHRIKYINKEDTLINVISSIALNALVENRMRKYPKVNEDYNKLKLVELNNTSYLIIPHFGIEFKQFKVELDCIFKKIKLTNSSNLIIDVRGNSGGGPKTFYYLLSYLTDKKLPSFITYSSINDNITRRQRKVSDNFNEIEPKKNHYTGTIYFISDASCLSGTGIFLSIVQYYKLGKIYGQETGVTNDGCNALSYKDYIVLTNSKIKWFNSFCSL